MSNSSFKTIITGLWLLITYSKLINVLIKLTTVNVRSSSIPAKKNCTYFKENARNKGLNGVPAVYFGPSIM